MRFDATDPNEDDEYQATKQALLDEFSSWRSGERGADDGTAVANADTFLTWRYNYSTGVLDEYRDDDIREFLLEWCPSKVSGPPQEAFDLSRAVAEFIEFLARGGRLRGGSGRAARLITLANDLAPDAFEAMGDPSKFGMAKSLFAGALGGPTGLRDLADVDPEDLQALLDERMNAFNALPMDERKAATDRFFEPRRPDPVTLPFLYVPPPAGEVEESAAVAPIVVKLHALREYLTPNGKPLTDRGNLKLADGRALIELLDTGDTMDAEIGDRTFKTQSTENLQTLAMIVELAKASGAVRVHQRRLVPVKGWARQSDVDHATSVFDVVVERGPLFVRHGGWSSWADAAKDLLDDGLLHWLAPLLPVGTEIDVAAIAEPAFDVVCAQIPPTDPLWFGSGPETWVARWVVQIVEVAQMCGGVDWHGFEEVEQHGFRSRTGGTISLTPLGRHLVARHLPAVGYAVPSAGDVSDASASELLSFVEMADADDLPGLVAAWQPQVDPVERARLVAGAMTDATTALGRLAGIAVFEVLDADVVEPFARELLDSPMAGHVAIWLVEHGFASEELASQFVGVGMLVDVLATSLDDPDELVSLFSESPSSSAAEATLEAMWRHEAAETAAVLDVLGRHLPDRRLAKAARKALLKHRSWMANRR